LFQRWSRLGGGLLFAGAPGAVLLLCAVAGHAGLVLAPGALFAAVLLALLIGALGRLDWAAEGRAPAWPRGAADAALMPPLAEHSTAPIVIFDRDGRIRAGNRALGEMFDHPAAELVGMPFGRLLDLPSHDLPRLFRRADGLVRTLIGRRRNGRRFHLHVALSTVEWRGERLRVAILHDVSEVRADPGVGRAACRG